VVICSLHHLRLWEAAGTFYHHHHLQGWDLLHLLHPEWDHHLLQEWDHHHHQEWDLRPQ